MKVKLWRLSTSVAIASDNALPDAIKLYQNYPNPFNPATTISFALPEPAHVRLQVFDVLGRPVNTLVDRFETAGQHEVLFRASGLASGFYFYRLNLGSTSVSRPMQLIK